VPVASRADYWRHVLGETIAPIEIRNSVHPAEMRDQALTSNLGDVTVTSMTITAGEAQQLPRHFQGSDTGERGPLGTAVLDLLAVALTSQLGLRRALPPESRQTALLARIRAYIERRLADPDLYPSTIADAHHISVRYLHKLFESEHTTVAAYIRRRRLERSRQDLLDPALHDRPVGAIGARWGFHSPAHFSRAFRGAYETTPGELRRTNG
jgi:AraC-like DNA-binding protein